MARGERNARFYDRAPTIDPFFTGSAYGMRGGGQAGYSQPDALDNTGYSISDPGIDARVGDGFIPDDVMAPLGGPRLGRVSLGSYGDDSVGGDPATPTPGGALGEAGAVWDRQDYGGIPVGEYLGPQHAIRPPPLEYGRERGVGGAHAGIGFETGLGKHPTEGGDPSVGPAVGGDGDDWGSVSPASGHSEYQGKDLDRRLLSDSEVYADLYGEGRSYAQMRGREDDGLDGLGRGEIALNDPADRGGDRAGYSQLVGKKLPMRGGVRGRAGFPGYDPGYS